MRKITKRTRTSRTVIRFRYICVYFYFFFLRKGIHIVERIGIRFSKKIFFLKALKEFE